MTGPYSMPSGLERFRRRRLRVAGAFLKQTSSLALHLLPYLFQGVDKGIETRLVKALWVSVEADEEPLATGRQVKCDIAAVAKLDLLGVWVIRFTFVTCHSLDPVGFLRREVYSN